MYDILLDWCVISSTVSFTHNGRVRNSDFQFPFKALPDDVTGFYISINGTGYAYLVLSSTDVLADDGEGDLGVPKIGM